MDWQDFDPAEHSSGDVVVLEPGEYIAWVKKFERKHRNGKEQIDMVCSVIADPEREERVSGSFWETATLTKEAIWKFAQMCEAIGTGRFNLNDDRAVAKAIKYQPFKVQLIVDEYAGKERNKANQYSALRDAHKALIEKLALTPPAERGYDGDPDASDRAGRGGGFDDPGFSNDDLPF